MSLPQPQIDELRGLLGQMAGGRLTGDETAQLNRLLVDDDAQRMFADYAMLDTCLEMFCQGKAEDMIDGRCGAVDHDSSQFNRSIPASVLTVPPLSEPHSSISSRFSVDTPLGSYLFSYGAATVLVGVLLLVFSLMNTSHPEGKGIAKSDPSKTERVTPDHKLRPEAVSVGRITGMVDCVWQNQDEAPVYQEIRLGDRFALKSGIMEIAYRTGARVILQGPCRYEVESAASGYLEIGKLTARVEKKRARKAVASDEWRVASPPLPPGEGGVRVMRQQPMTASDAVVSGPLPAASAGGDSPAPRPTPHVPLFAIRTPTAVVTDLGTEFGVEVEKSGNTVSHVFVGKIKVRTVESAAGQEAREVVLGANESVRVEKPAAGKSATPLAVRRGPCEPGQFVRVDQMAVKMKAVSERPLKAYRQWKAFSRELRERDDLVVYYDFQRDSDNPRDKDGREILRNRSKTGSAFDGTLFGSVRLGMAQGRCPGKQALEFNSSNDGVRVNLDVRLSSYTMVAWVNINWLPDEFCGILLSDQFFGREGAFHWQLAHDGQMQFAINDGVFKAELEGCNWNAAIPDWNANRPNGWRRFAVVCDEQTKCVTAYIDGQRIAMTSSRPMAKWMPLEIGHASIGSWDCNKRPLGGRIDELMIFNRALSEKDVQGLFEFRERDAGKAKAPSGEIENSGAAKPEAAVTQ